MGTAEGEKMNIQVIHTLAKHRDVYQAGIYIQIPEEGVPDRQGRYYRHLKEDIKVEDAPNDAITRCLEEVFNKSREVNCITYVGPRGRKIELQRGTPTEEIREKIREG